MSQEGQEAHQIARQGHRYTCNGKDVLALESGRLVKILYFDPDKPWLGEVGFAQADKLIPQPMKYFGGQIPS